MTSPLRGFELAGPEVAEALEWLFVHTDVAGVAELEIGDEASGGAPGHVVYLTEPLPKLPFARVTVREVAVSLAMPTGLEADRPIEVAPGLLVRPPWVEPVPGFAGIELIVPRGNAFGSGEHDSTQAALVTLHELWGGPVSCADVGAGSGILLLYVATRGATALQACDIDPAAVTATSELVPSATVRCGGPDLLDPAECVIANMTGAELTNALADILALWHGGGPLVLSGMRAQEVDPIARAVPHVEVCRVTRGAFTALGYSGAR